VATVGILHPGEMGAAVGAALVSAGHAVAWASEGRSDETAARAKVAGLRDVGSVAEVVSAGEVVFSVCPPHAARDVGARVAVAGFTGTFVDANAVSPATAAAIGSTVEAAGATFVDGGIVGPPPGEGVDTRLYLSGSAAATVAGLFEGTTVSPVVLDGAVGAASALKMTYAGWTKGTTALLLAIRAAARAHGVEDALLAEWAESLPELPARSAGAARSAATKGWRWVGEMEEIASTLATAHLPPGFHEAAAEVFRRSPRLSDPDVLDAVLAGLVHEA
jgi:3-hydroxyisobutyrate dehydrogenase-like beta-hydroxyacid dehydrogenase